MLSLKKINHVSNLLKKSQQLFIAFIINSTFDPGLQNPIPVLPIYFELLFSLSHHVPTILSFFPQIHYCIVFSKDFGLAISFSQTISFLIFINKINSSLTYSQFIFHQRELSSSPNLKYPSSHSLTRPCLASLHRIITIQIFSVNLHIVQVFLLFFSMRMGMGSVSIMLVSVDVQCPDKCLTHGKSSMVCYL